MIGFIFITLKIIVAKQFEIKFENGGIMMETMNGFEVELQFQYHDIISTLNQMKPSKCTQNCLSCSKPQCYLQNTELDHANIKMFDLDKQESVLQPLTYINNQQHLDNQIFLFRFEKYQNSFADDGFQLCFSQKDKIMEISTQDQFMDIDPKKQLISKLRYTSRLTYFTINYLKFGDTLIDISNCSIFMDSKKDYYNLDNEQDLSDNEKFFFQNIMNGLVYLPQWVFNQLSSELLKQGFVLSKTDGNESIIQKFKQLPDFLFFNQENELNPIIYSQDSYLEKLQKRFLEENLEVFIDEDAYILKMITSNKNDSMILLGTSFFQNKKMYFNFKENLISIQNYYEERCFKFDRSSLYQEELLFLYISIPSIIILSLLLIKYQEDFASAGHQ